MRMPCSHRELPAQQEIPKRTRADSKSHAETRCAPTLFPPLFPPKPGSVPRERFPVRSVATLESPDTQNAARPKVPLRPTACPTGLESPMANPNRAGIIIRVSGVRVLLRHQGQAQQRVFRPLSAATPCPGAARDRRDQAALHQVALGSSGRSETNPRWPGMLLNAWSTDSLRSAGSGDGCPGRGGRLDAGAPASDRDRIRKAPTGARALNARHGWATDDEFEALLPTIASREEVRALNEQLSAPGSAAPAPQPAELVRLLLLDLAGWASGIRLAGRASDAAPPER